MKTLLRILNALTRPLLTETERRDLRLNAARRGAELGR